MVVTQSSPEEEEININVMSYYLQIMQYAFPPGCTFMLGSGSNLVVKDTTGTELAHVLAPGLQHSLRPVTLPRLTLAS